jgi:hypothetical protein
MSDINERIRESLQQLNKDATRLFKKTEKNLIEAYTKTKKTTEDVIVRAQREKLYYELGKFVAPLLTSEQLKNKNILRLATEIQSLSKKIRRK